MNWTGILLGAGMLAFSLPAGSAEIYKWTDDEGRVHYGDEAPSDSIPEFKIKPPPVVLPDKAYQDVLSEQQHKVKQRKLLESFEAERREQQQAEQERQRMAAIRQQNCKTARARLRSAQNANLIYDRDKQGNRIFYNKAQRKQYLLRLRSEVSQWCE
jgi:hypothetical protein